MNQNNGNGKRLDGKVAIITGATGGIGEATAKRFLEEGARVMLVGRSAEKLKETRERLSGFENVADFVADATDEAATKASVEATVEAVWRFGYSAGKCRNGRKSCTDRRFDDGRF